MNFCSYLRRPTIACGFSAALLSVGCMAEFLKPKQRVLVDAISGSEAPKLNGLSYRLVARKSVVTGQQVQLPVVKACVDAALVRSGMYEAPHDVPSDIFIEINYGMDTSSRLDPSTRESFLDLSARSNKAHALDSTHEEELWDVRVAVTGLATRFESAMPLLATVAARYAGSDTHIETVEEVADASPEVTAVRESAIKALASNPTPTAAPASGATPASATAN